MEMATMCAYPQYQHALPHWKCEFCCCYNFPRGYIPGQESDRHIFNTSPTITFHFYLLITCCTVHGRRPLDERKICRLCLKYPASVSPAKPYTRKKLVVMETYIDDFCTIFYIPEIKNISFHLPHVHILGTNHFGNTHREAFKHSRASQYVLCCRDYYGILVASFSHQLKHEYYSGN